MVSQRHGEVVGSRWLDTFAEVTNQPFRCPQATEQGILESLIDVPLDGADVLPIQSEGRGVRERVI